MGSKFTHRNAKILNSFLFSPKSNLLFQFCSIVRSQNLPKLPDPIWSHGTFAACAPTHLFVNTARCFLRDARRNTSTPMIFTDYLENVAEPNQYYVQQNLHSPRHVVRQFSRFSRNRPKTIRQTNDLTSYLVIGSFRNFVILFMFGEAETSSAEEQLVKE